ncbi:erythrocyte membrane protein 1, PfEMP1, putative [Plasmodium reichenowi]|uniref:Erythrocyte membrane protein 1, PfEMP1, putative n=1 Tax=Plasmodium reichenowi TaxID=5854 RepID=A0A2P9D4W7_PLARE|nr:erythrocyte membrane protein 1, PfEMP1, putative [Plasmodium reichenowi]
MAATKPAASGPDYKNVNNAKDLFDEVGKYIQQQVRKEALNYPTELIGYLQSANFSDDTEAPSVPCQLNYEVHTNVTRNVIDPCNRKSEERFSNTQGAQCDNSKIKGNRGKGVKSEGACAPYRRLSLCDTNLEQIKPNKIDNTHNLLVDVCMAAKYEGQSIKGYHDKYKETNPGSQLCTMLARSFADIGDIIRGKDLYHGDNEENIQLENNLKAIFRNIQNSNKKLQKLSLNEIREYWWSLNRQKVWKALTCKAPKDAEYFRFTCSHGRSLAHNNCMCVDGDPPTFFDYVPQYLRWFEEWAEDFCRKKKKYVDTVRTKCRGESEGEKYCSFNGYDCEETINKIGKLVIGNDCTKCSVSCSLYEKWLGKQKKEFLKQKEKYKKEIEKYERKRVLSGNNKNEYDELFYKELENKYRKVREFLGLLNSENACIKVKEDGGKINFAENHDDTSEEHKGTFYRSEYCQRCPECGVKCERGQKCKEKPPEDRECSEPFTYNPPKDAEIHKINVLYSGEGNEDMTKKLREFCTHPKEKNGERNEEWECYYEDNKDNKCNMKKDVPNEQEHNKIMSFNEFFKFWMGHLLSDTVHWRTELTRCFNDNNSKSCKRICKKKCECFQNWVNKKQEEWEEVKDQYEKQEDMGGFGHYWTLEMILENDYFPIIEEDYKGLKSVQEMKRIIKKNSNNVNAARDKNSINEMLDHELKEATKCKEKQEECQRKKFKNPCYVDKSATNVVGVKEVAAEVQQKTHAVMLERSREGRKNKSSLEGDITQAKFKNGGSVNTLNGVCSITQDHSNAGNDESKNPCHGKGNGLQIGDTWKEAKSEGITTGVYIRPRREHICTSNLEKIDDNWVIKNANDHVNDTFLVDVLHAAKSEAADIINKYNGRNTGQNKGKNGLTDEKTVCRAMKSSFADIGDIIRGRDLWDYDSGSREMEDHLKKIFNKIKQKHPDIQSKYKSDNEKHTKLRADWWEANRDQVWNAMKCHISELKDTSTGSAKSDHCGYRDHAPYDDYIPQRLRWMTEWAEWYCKYQSQAYGELLGACGRCKGKGKGQCTQGTQKCQQCTTACGKYKEEIQKWQRQWQQMQIQYPQLYRYAQRAVENKGDISRFGTAIGEKDKPVVQFLQELPKKNGDTTTSSSVTSPYSTTPGYIHQELGTNMGCNVQTQFCNNNSSPYKYAFKNLPHDHDDACKCTERPPQPSGPAGRSENTDESLQPPLVENHEEEGGTDYSSEEEEEEDKEEENTEQDETVAEVTPKAEVKPCEIVKELFKDPNKFSDACGLKYGKNYGWRCIPTGNGSIATSEGSVKSRQARSLPSEKSDPKSDATNGGICIPPRRRKLYIGPLKKWATSDETQSKSQADGERGSTGSSDKEVGSGGDGKVVGSSGEAAVSGGENGESQLQNDGQSTLNAASSTSTTSSSLLHAFIESAAVETFFLWDRYKKLNTPQVEGPLGAGYGADYSTGYRNDYNSGPFGRTTPGEMRVGGGLPGAMGSAGPAMPGRGLAGQEGEAGLPSPGTPPLLPQLPSGMSPPNGFGKSTSLQENASEHGYTLPSSESDDQNNPHNQLLSGKIPPSFLRQMFYTIADYRDILVRGGKTQVGDNTNNDKTNIVLLASEKKDEMKEIQKAIEQHLQKQSNTAVPSSEKPSSPSSDKRTALWGDFAPYVWNGMICALTYKEKDTETSPIGIDSNTNKIEQDTELKGALLDTSGKQPKKEEYQYDKVVLKDTDSDTLPKPTGGDSTINNPKLKDFVSRPPFFRYLEEWGESFCRQRKEMLENIKKECTEEGSNGGRTTNCSGDGFECTKNGPNKDGTFRTFDCPNCAINCRSYRKWIEKKKQQFDKQEKAYGGQKKNCENGSESGAGNGVCGKLEENAAKFLNRLKNGPCKTNNGNESGEHKTAKSHINFGDKETTFKHTKHCDPCSSIDVKCNKNDCEVAKRKECQSKTITKQDIENIGDSTEISMLVSDDNTNKSENVLEACQDKCIFQGIRKDVWKCRKFCDVDVCGLKNGNGGIHEKPIILISALFKRWVENFIEDYNKINKKLKPCINKNKESICQKKCECVKEWIDQKRTEWETIRERYLKPYESTDSPIYYNVKSFLETLQHQTEFKEAIKPCGSLDDFQNSKECAVAANSEKGEDADKKDIIQCLLDKLQNEIQTCEQKHSDKPNQTPCPTLSHSGEKSTPDVEDVDDEEEENEEENPENMRPNICPKVEEKKKEEDEEECKPAEPPIEDKKEDEEGKGEGAAPSPESPESPPGDGTKETKQEEAVKPSDPEETHEVQKKKAPAPAVVDKKKDKKQRQLPPQQSVTLYDAMLYNTLAWCIGIGITGLSYWFLKKKTKLSVDLLRVMQIPQNDYGMPTKRSPNRYIPYKSAQYKGKTYLYVEGDSGTDSGYTDHYSDITSSSESEYEEFDINDIYVPGTPKYKTLIEVVLEPSKRDTQNGDTIPNSDNTIPTSDNTIPTSGKNTPTSDIPSDIQNDIPSDNTPTKNFTDEEWNQLKKDFISNMLQSEQPNDVPNDYTSGDIPTNTNNTTMSSHNVDNNTHPTPSRHNVDNNTHPTPSRHTLDQKPFIMSIHDRNLLSGEEYSYDMTTNSDENNLYSGTYGPYSDKRGSYSGTKDPISGNHNPYSGIDLINDSLNSGNQPIDIYDEVLKRKENELFGTKHHPKKHTTGTHNVAKNTNSDPIMNQLDLFHKWLDRHRDMCEKWDKNNKVDILNQLKEKWENETHSGNKTSGNITPTSDNTPPTSDNTPPTSDNTPPTSDNTPPTSDNTPPTSDNTPPTSDNTPPTSDIPSGKLSDTPSSNKTLNTDVSIQIHLDNNQVDDIYLDTYPDKYTVDDIYLDTYPDKYTVDNNPNLVGNINPVDTPTKVQIELDVNKKTIKEKYPIGDVWDI